MMPNQDREVKPPLAVVTPFVAMILDLVKESCDPQVEGWADRLAESLTRRFFNLVKPGESISADAFNALQLRLFDVEEKLSPLRTQAVRRRSILHPNY